MHINVKEAVILEFYAQQSAQHPSQKMTLRVGHIKDVVRHGMDIADAIGLDKHGKALVKLMTYLHDYYQVLQIAGNAPDPHLHHSNLEAIEKVLFDNGQIDEYAEGLSDFDKEVIKTAIVQHAKITVELPADADPHFVLFCNILRDADKSAIYELIKEPIYVLKNDWGFSDEQIKSSTSKDGATVGVSPKVLSDFMSGQCILNTDIQTPADWSISQLGYLYDVKTDVAFKSMLQNAAILISYKLPFSDVINDIVRGCYYHALNVLVIKR
ncbi:hypothetical protein FWF89_01785 [Candidatus Saccharibacteria bacterium]|nr:hypothetical protein [Candidatus Saccharibacteria bacterium]